MDTFKRYFVHFLLIILVVAMIIIIVAKPHISLKYFLLYFSIVLTVFVIPMSLFFSHQESTITINVPCDSETAYNQMLATIEAKTGRILLSQSENTMVYSVPASKIELLTKYKRWLTNNITVINRDSVIEIVTPRCFRNYFSIFNEKIAE